MSSNHPPYDGMLQALRLLGAFQLAVECMPFEKTVILHFLNPFGLNFLVAGRHVAGRTLVFFAGFRAL